MKIKSFLSLIFLFTLGTALSQTFPGDASSAGREFLNALLEKNTKQLGSLMGSDFVLLSYDGQSIDSGTLLEAVGSGAIVIESANSYGDYTRHYQDTGIINGIWNVKGSIQGQSFNNRLAYSLVVVRQGGAWKVVSLQFTPS